MIPLFVARLNVLINRKGCTDGLATWRAFARNMMTSGPGNVFRFTGPLCGESTGDRWIPPTKGPVVRTCDVFFVATWLSCQTNSWNVGDLRRHMFLGSSRWDSSYCCNASHTLCRGLAFCCVVLGTSAEQPRGLWVNSHEAARAYGTTIKKTNINRPSITLYGGCCVWFKPMRHRYKCYNNSYVILDQESIL